MNAITINQKAIKQFNLKSINKVYNFLNQMGILTFVIAAERTPTGNNVHYHVLVEDLTDNKERELWTMAIWNDTVNNEIAYFEYICKDGNYKIFNGYEKPLTFKSENEYEMFLADIYENGLTIEQIRIKYAKLFVKHYHVIQKIYAQDLFKNGDSKVVK